MIRVGVFGVIAASSRRATSRGEGADVKNAPKLCASRLVADRQADLDSAIEIPIELPRDPRVVELDSRKAGWRPDEPDADGRAGVR